MLIEALRNGDIICLKPSRLAHAKNVSLPTIYRDIKAKRIAAEIDPVTKRLFIPAAAALAYLEGEPYKHDRLNEDAITRMGRARAAKQNKEESSHG